MLRDAARSCQFAGARKEILHLAERSESRADHLDRRCRIDKRGVWNSRLQYTGDFETLAEALAAIMTAYLEAHRIRCYEYTVDDEFAREVAPLARSEENWLPSAY
jgi:hypothetical protein